MLTKLHLQQFKNFQDATLSLGGLTLIVGTNASGKSNIRDAFRFLHGIARGYNLAQIFGGKYRESFREWQGIRGGIREVVFQTGQTFSLEVSFSFGEEDKLKGGYKIEVNPHVGMEPYVMSEQLYLDQPENYIFKSDVISDLDSKEFPVQFRNSNFPAQFDRRHPCLLQLGFTKNTFLRRYQKQVERLPEETQLLLQEVGAALLNSLEKIRFLDPEPDAMRQRSIPGETVLSDRGENLSSVLQAICENSKKKQVLLDWIRELTPMDAKDFEFSNGTIAFVNFALRI